jgi:DNA repair ATPase RecN
LQNKLEDWQSSLNGYKPLADTGNYPGKDEIADGLALVRRLLTCDTSFKFIELFNSQKDALLDSAEQFSDLHQFYESQKPTWEKLRKAYDRFQLNHLELERNAQAGPALRRMGEILTAPSPYGLIREADGLITTVDTVNSVLVNERRRQAVKKIDEHIANLSKDIATAKGDASLQAACLRPLEALRQQVTSEESLAHIAQAEAEALREFDDATLRVHEYLVDYDKRVGEKPAEKGNGLVIKKQRIVEPAKLTKATYIETIDEANAFLDTLRQELETAINNNERIQIR